MVRMTVRELSARPWRALLTGLAAVVGVGLVSGTFVLLDTAERAGGVDSDVRELGDIVRVAGVVALLVGAFIVNAALTVTLAQRARELGQLRCLGADAAQLRRMVWRESLVIGVLASLTGLAFGVGVAAALRAFVNSAAVSGDLGGQALVVTPRTVIVSLLAGSAVMLLSALAPARRAGRAAPLAALGGRPPAPVGARSAIRTVAGAVVAGAGLVAVPLAVATGIDHLLLLGAALVLAGVRLVGPRLARPLAGAVGLPVARTLRAAGALGRANAMRTPERTAATAAALMIGLALVTFVVVLGASTKAPIPAAAARTADLLVYPGRATQAPVPIGAGAVVRLSALPELSPAVPVQYTQGAVGGAQADVYAVDPARFSQVVELDVRAGSVSDLSAGAIGVTDDVAAANGWTVGTRVPVRLPRGTQTFTVRAVYAADHYGLSTGGLPYMMVPSDYARLGGDPRAVGVYSRVADGVSQAAARAAVERALAGHPELVVEDRAQARRQAAGEIDGALSLYLALTGLAVVVGLFGLANTMALSIAERVHELGLLRAVGMDRRQVRSMIRAEALIVATVGTLLGIALGTFFAWGAAKLFEDSSEPTRFSVPLATLALVAALAAGAGVVAAMLPARWASRVPMLRAIASE
jgi:putative ABC transport system permease protein